MAKNLINKYVWLVDTIYRAGHITFEEINEKWLDQDMDDRPIPLRTFHKWRIAAEDMFGLVIDCDRKGGYRYYIENRSEIKRGGLRNWLLSTINVHPYCVKLFKQRWYLIALSPYYQKVMIYALDRIFDILKLEGQSFKMPEDFDPEEFFSNYYGIIAGTKRKLETVKLKVSAGQANYLRSLPLHGTQDEIETTPEYSIFQLRICPEFDFYQEVLSKGDDFEVLEPYWLRKEIAGIVKRMWNKYKED